MALPPDAQCAISAQLLETVPVSPAAPETVHTHLQTRHAGEQSFENLSPPNLRSTYSASMILHIRFLRHGLPRKRYYGCSWDSF